MKAIRERLEHQDQIGERYYILCPACYEVYKEQYPEDERFWINGAIHCFSAAIHSFNGDLERPTISPSLLCKGVTKVCHSFVNDGNIQYLGDCTHSMANQTVPLMDVPESMIKEMTA